MRQATTRAAPVAAASLPVPPAVPVGGAPLGLDAAAAIAEGRAVPVLAPAARGRIAAAHARLAACIAESRHVYGVTTGFGPLAGRLVGAEAAAELQEGLIAHLATGVGPALSWSEARMVVLARLVSIAQGWSGASPALADLLAALLASPFAPRIPSKGTVGASGDLTPLAHVALALTGRGAFLAEGGAPVDNARVFAALGLPPHRLAARDGLALVNGTSAMTGIAVLSARRAARLVAWGEALSVGVAELLRGRAEAWHPAFAEARPHPGQRTSAARLRTRIAHGSRMRGGLAADRRLLPAGAPGTAPGVEEPLQDAYTLRCVPQILGAVRDVLAFHDATVLRELNAATDNPIFPGTGAPALHGGNFMGQHVAFAADALSSGVIAAAGLAERQIARLTDERLNGGLPAFLHRGAPGLNSGFMGAQVTATALLAEMRSNAVPASIQSISTNGANQDVVSMGTIAARKCAAHLDDAARIAAILALAVAQGVDIVAAGEGGGAGAGEAGAGFSEATRALAAEVRRISPPLERDRPLSDEIEAVAGLIGGSLPPE